MPMHRMLRESELLDGLGENEVGRLAPLARHKSLGAGDYLFLLGDHASHLYVVLEGRVDICFPLSLRGAMRDIAIESKGPGHTIGWSVFVQPYRFTFSARAARRSEVAVFDREQLRRIVAEDPGLGYALMSRISQVIGHRLLKMQALWARELQRAVADGLGPPREEWRASGFPAPRGEGESRSG